MNLELLFDGCGYLESPRWRDASLWVSDLDNRRVLAYRDGELQSVADVPGVPSGLAFVPTGTLVVSMLDQHVVHVDADGLLSVWADLSGVAVGSLNDCVRDERGNLYVGCFGYDLTARETPRPGPLLHVDVGGSCQVACPDLMFANGMVVTDGGCTLIVAESAARRITRFRIGAQGELSKRALVADLGVRQPDGLCLDAEGGLWFASPFTEEFVRLAPNGSITHVVPTPGRWAVACALGGPDGSTFYAVTAETDLKRFARGESRGRVEVTSAPVPAVS